MFFVLAVTSDQLWLLAVNVSVFLAFYAQISLANKKLASERVAADAKAKEDREALAVKTDQKLDQIHTLQNGHMGVQLNLTAIALRSLADETVTGDPNKLARDNAAAAAEKAYKDHMETLNREAAAKAAAGPLERVI